jgi:hypothetical protein
MKNLSHTLKVRKNGLTKIQAEAKQHFHKHPDGAEYGARMVDATSFLKMVVLFIASLVRPELDRPYRATFGHITNWDACIPWQGKTSDDGYAPSGAIRRIAKFFGLDIPKGARVAHICHQTKSCSAAFKCPHRACVNPLHWYVTTPSGCISRSHNAPKGEGKKIAAYKLTWLNCWRGHSTTPGKDCAECNAIHQATSRVNTAARLAEIEEAIRNGELFYELNSPTLLELTR